VLSDVKVKSTKVKDKPYKLNDAAKGSTCRSLPTGGSGGASRFSTRCSTSVPSTSSTSLRMLCAIPMAARITERPTLTSGRR